MLKSEILKNFSLYQFYKSWNECNLCDECFNFFLTNQKCNVNKNNRLCCKGYYKFKYFLPSSGQDRNS